MKEDLRPLPPAQILIKEMESWSFIFLRLATFIKYLVTVHPRPESLRKEASESTGAKTRSFIRSQTTSSYP